jgi:hypothetical protein
MQLAGLNTRLVSKKTRVQTLPADPKKIRDNTTTSYMMSEVQQSNETACFKHGYDRRLNICGVVWCGVMNKYI